MTFQNRAKDWTGYRHQLEKFRLRHDSLNEFGVPAAKRAHEIERCVRQKYLATAVQVTQDLFPGLADTIETVRRRIALPCAVEVYIYNSPEMQAHCSGGSDEHVFVALSSALVRHLDQKEICFVLGHEIGHHVFGH